MANTFTFTIDGVEIKAEKGQTIMQAADAAGIYIPRLCAHHSLEPHGSCRVCTVLVNGRPQPSCIQPAAPGIVVENDTEKIKEIRKLIVEMLFVEGNHFCPFCEKSGNCELQAMCYRLGILSPRLPYQFPKREVDTSHPDIILERNRCILCGRCVRASRDIDGKHVFDFVGRGRDIKISVNADAYLADTDLTLTDKAISVCPVGSILRKEVGYKIPIGERLYDHKPIGSDIEEKKQ